MPNSGKILEIAFSIVIPIVATFGGYAVGLQKGRDDMCPVARECEPGFSAKFVSPGCTKPDPWPSWTAAHPDLSKKPTVSHLARIAVEFEYHLRVRDSEDFLHGDPPSRVYWIAKLGRLALRRDGSWDYIGSARHCQTKKDFEAIRAQRFVNFEEAVRVATSVFGAEPEHAAYMRKHAVELENNNDG